MQCWSHIASSSLASEVSKCDYGVSLKVECPASVCLPPRPLSLPKSSFVFSIIATLEDSLSALRRSGIVLQTSRPSHHASRSHHGTQSRPEAQVCNLHDNLDPSCTDFPTAKGDQKACKTVAHAPWKSCEAWAAAYAGTEAGAYRQPAT